MSRRSRNAKAAGRVAASAPPAASADIQGFGVGWGAGQGHQGADWSRQRGYVYFPQLDTRREITSYTRTETLRRGRFLYANHGLAKRIVNGLARMIAGTGLIPEGATGDKPWNRDAGKVFAQDTDSQFAFDVGGRYNFDSSQTAMLRFHFRDGDCSAPLSSSATGRGRMAFYEGHAVGQATGTPVDQPDWVDGVNVDPVTNAARAYRYPGEGDTYTDLNASDVIFYANYERAGQSRGLTILSHAINHLLDVAEITGYIKTGVKLANQYGFWIEQQPGTTKPSSGAGDRVAGSKQTVTSSAGNVTIEKIYGAGQIPDLLPGQSLKFNSASHPHPNNLTLMEFLIRDIAWGVGMSPELLWNIAALGGANTRFVMADAQGWIEEQQAMLVRLYCQRVWVYFIAKAMKSGRLRKCLDPEWWKCNWITPPRLTVDFGKEGKLQIEQLKAGVITYTRLLGWQGQEFEPHMNKWLDEIAFVKAGLNKKNGKARTDDDRNLTWEDIQMWRNTEGNTRIADNNTGSIANDNAALSDLPADPSQASAFLAEMAKDPARAAKFLADLRALPEAA